MMNERQRNTIAAASTAIVLGLLWILLLIFSLSRPYPPPPEYGVEVNFGNSMDGMGRIQPDFLSESSQAMSRPQASAEDNVVTTSNDNVSLPSQPVPRDQRQNPTPTQETTPQPQEPQINQDALFPGRRTTQGGNQGTTGNPGDQGDPTGSRDGTAQSGT